MPCISHVHGEHRHSRPHLLPRVPCAARMKQHALLPEVSQARARSSFGDRSVIRRPRRKRRERAIPIMPAPPPDRFTSFIHCYTASSSLSSSHHSAIHTDFGRDLTLCTQIDNHYTADKKMHRPLITSRAKSRNPLVCAALPETVNICNIPLDRAIPPLKTIQGARSDHHSLTHTAPRRQALRTPVTNRT